MECVQRPHLGGRQCTRSRLSVATATLGFMVMLGVHVGAREDDADPIDEAKRSGADGVQIFLADPQGWKTPKPHPLAAAVAGSPTCRSTCTHRMS